MNIIYRGYEIVVNKNSFLVYGNNDMLIREFSKSEARMNDVRDYINKLKREGKWKLGI